MEYICNKHLPPFNLGERWVLGHNLYYDSQFQWSCLCHQSSWLQEGKGIFYLLSFVFNLDPVPLSFCLAERSIHQPWPYQQEDQGVQHLDEVKEPSAG